ncbi:flavin reductase family protein [Rarobacter faecitabidus]|uniref:Flavin reductase (DIM6/NTAB) family NADH-FMN oxidoreductase RutF n=1 Tax=Rarobacter faecitabidus TaxID=13243 RepID=A0A542ZTV9_RARFA|nr:flavin reductase family protein [Rarobacter faecitabidus]TQL63793.1 flavin reductase (DIM6/NTAB) family NADH-FMN oxidoreductase RutF [Rarobacter faecitabidus]
MNDASEQFRDVSNRLAKGVAVVTARHRGLDVARTVTDVIAVSWDPPTVLVSLYSLGRMAEAVEDADSWALSFLSASQRGIAQWLSEPGTPLIGLLDSVPHHRRAPEGPALIDGALAWVVARTSDSFEVATHVLTAGAVTWMGANAEAGAEPLIRQFGQYIQS